MFAKDVYFPGYVTYSYVCVVGISYRACNEWILQLVLVHDRPLLFYWELIMAVPESVLNTRAPDRYRRVPLVDFRVRSPGRSLNVSHDHLCTDLKS